MTNKPYYVLFEFEHGKWVVNFGDYDRSVVKFELQVVHEGHVPVPLRNLKIIKCLNANKDTIEYQQQILNKFGDNPTLSQS